MKRSSRLMMSNDRKFALSCPNCGKRYSVADGSAGKRVKCSACGAVFRIQAASFGAPESASSAADTFAPMTDLLNEALGAHPPENNNGPILKRRLRRLAIQDQLLRWRFVSVGSIAACILVGAFAFLRPSSDDRIPIA